MKNYVRYRWIGGLFMLIGFLLFTPKTKAQTSPINETFENVGPYGGYQTETWTGDDGGTWTATDARTDQTINGKAITIRDGVLTSPSVTGGIGALTVTTQRQFGGGSGDLDIVVNGSNVGTVPYDGTEQTTTVPNIDVAGIIIVELQNNSDPGDRIGIDDLSWTAFAGSGNPAPFITNISQTPSDGSVTSSDAVSVSAEISDSDGITSATLNWGTTSGSLTTSIAMSAGSGDTYTTDSDIPIQTDGTTVYYEIEATDNNTSPETATSSEQSYQVHDPAPAPSLIFSEVADPVTYEGRFVEIHNNGSNSIDFSTTTVYLAKYSNGHTNAQSVQLTGTIAAGDFYVIAGSNSGFNTSYGSNPDLSSGIANGNGDDVYALYVGGDEDSGDLFDIYGEIGVDGNGEAWEYEDSRAVRNDLSVTPKTTWTASEWTITPADVGDMTPGTGESGGGNQGPDISNIAQTPSPGNVTASDAVSVSAEITDSDGVATATLNWGTTSGNLSTSITMSAGSGDTYTSDTDIPAQADGTTVYYEIEATDNNASPETTMSPEQSYISSDPTPPGVLIITEIMPDPDAVGDGDGEYFEVYNNSNSPVDMNGWNISDNGSNSDDISSTLIVPAHGFVTIGKSADSEINGGIAVDYTISGSLSNSDDEVIITDDTGTEIDRVEYGGSSSWPDPTGASMYFTGTVSQDNNDGSLWAISTKSIAIGDDLGSPGFAGEGQIGQANTYTYENDMWSDPISNVTDNDDVQVLSGSTPANFGSDADVRSIAVASGAALDVENTLTISGHIVTNGAMIFKSNSTLDGELGTVPESSQVIGDIQVNRYMSANRAFRSVSSPVTTSTSIHENWQEGATSNTDDPNPGFGTHITGTNTDQENGFDATASGNPSLFTLDVGNQEFVPIGNTDVNTLSAGDPYFLFVRGDRSTDLTTNEATPTETVIRTTGKMFTGPKIESTYFTDTDGEFNLLGNPYQSSVDINEVLDNPGSTNLDNGQYYIYDPSLGDNGSFVTVILPAGTNTSGSSADEYLQPGQSAQIATSNSGSGTAQIEFQEDDKAPNNNNTTFSQDDPITNNPHIIGQLFTTESYSSGGPLYDSFGLLFSESFDNAIAHGDAPKPMNFGENMGVDNGGNLYSIERRNMPEEGQQIQLFTNNYAHNNYTVVLELQEISGVSAYLTDNFTGENVALENGENTYAFEVDPTVPGSVATDRFLLHFESETLSNPGFDESAFLLYPNPVRAGQAINITSKNLNGDKVGVKIADVLGKTVYKGQHKFNGNTLTLHSNSLQAGVYFMKLQQKDRTMTKKLIVK